MTAHLSPVEAYRQDVLRVPGRESIGEEDAAWLVLAHVTWRMAGRGGRAALVGGTPADGTPVGAALGPAVEAALDAARVGAYGPLAQVVGDGALRMEQSGALLLAATTLSALRGVLAGSGGEALLVGRVLAQWARVERHLGDFDVARDLYEEAARLGRRHRIAELVVRADLGLAVLARIRGNYPAARAGFRRGLRRAERAGLGELTGLAHQGLLIAAAVAGDFDTALTHGWAAFAQVAGDPVKEAEVLVNLATLCLDAHEDAAALRAFAAAAERTRDVRTWISATAGTAAAAARLGRREVVDACAAAVERALATEGTPYERAVHFLTLTDAFADAGVREVAEAYRERGLALARTHGFAEIEHQLAVPRTPASAASAAAPPTPATRLGAGARRVVRELRTLAAPEAPVSRAPTVAEGGDGTP